MGRQYFHPCLTCSSSNWSPPKAATQGLIPPVPKAMRISPAMDSTLEREDKPRTNKRQQYYQPDTNTSHTGVSHGYSEQNSASVHTTSIQLSCTSFSFSKTSMKQTHTHHYTTSAHHYTPTHTTTHLHTHTHTNT